MARHRFFVTGRLARTGGDVEALLGSDDLHHAASVLRIRAGDVIELAEPEGGSVWVAEVSGIGRAGMSVRLVDEVPVSRTPRVALVQGVAKGEKMDLIVRQAVEVGVSEIYPVFTERSVVRIDAARRPQKGERWRRVAKAAAEQAHRASVPVVHDPCELAEAVEAIAGYDRVIVLWEEARAGDEAGADVLSETLDGSVALVVGPEGGLSTGEVDSLVAGGGKVASLGETILRTETAAMVGLALVLRACGALGAIGHRP